MPELNNNPFSALLPNASSTSQEAWRWGTVTSVSPLLVRLDGDSSPVGSSPDTVVGVKINDRVRVHIYNRRLTIMGVAGGGSSPLSAYPIGSYYWSSEPTNPTEIFGGAWKRVQGRFLFATDNSHPAGSTGGEETHTLTEAEMPRHAHPPRHGSYVVEFGNGNGMSWRAGTALATPNAGGYAGGNQPHNNMPPYISAYCWKRIG